MLHLCNLTHQIFQLVVAQVTFACACACCHLSYHVATVASLCCLSPLLSLPCLTQISTSFSSLSTPSFVMSQKPSSYTPSFSAKAGHTSGANSQGNHYCTRGPSSSASPDITTRTRMEVTTIKIQAVVHTMRIRAPVSEMR